MNLTGNQIKNTYQTLVNVVGNTVTDGTGSVVTTLPITASQALIAVQALTASLALTASFALNASSGSSVSSSYALTSSRVTDWDGSVSGNPNCQFFRNSETLSTKRIATSTMFPGVLPLDSPSISMTFASTASGLVIRTGQLVIQDGTFNDNIVLNSNNPNAITVVGNISASAVTASRFVGTADSASNAVTASYFPVTNFNEQSVGRAKVISELYTSSFASQTNVFATTPFQLRVLGIGDSLADNARYGILNAFKDKYGVIQGPGPEFSLNGGTAALVTGAFSFWPNGNYYNVISGSYFEPLFDTVTQTEANSCKIYYIKEPDAGTAKVEFNVAGESIYRLLGTLSASAGVTTGSVASFTYFNSLGSVRITGTTGSIKVIGVKYIQEGQPGVQLASVTQDGLVINSLLTCSNAIMAPILSDMRPHAVYYFAAEDETYINSFIGQVYSNFNTAIGYVPDWIFCARPGTGSANVAERTALRNFAISQSQTFIDFGPKLSGVMLSDAIHPTTEGYIAVGHAIANCAIFPPYTRQFTKMFDDNSIVTRGTFPQTSLWNIGKLLPLVPGAYASSGTGATAAASNNNGWGGRLNSGTGASSYGMETFIRGINTIPGSSGAGINTDIPSRYALSFLITTGTSSCARLIIGGTGGAPAASNADALSAKGWGLELRTSSSNFVGKLFAHNGTSYETSSWFVVRASLNTFEVPYACIVEKSGSHVFGYFPAGSTGIPSRHPQLHLSTSLAGSTGASTSYVDAVCVNDTVGSIQATDWQIQHAQLEIMR